MADNKELIAQLRKDADIARQTGTPLLAGRIDQAADALEAAERDAEPAALRAGYIVLQARDVEILARDAAKYGVGPVKLAGMRCLDLVKIQHAEDQ